MIQGGYDANLELCKTGWKQAVRHRYQKGEWRSSIFRDLIISSIHRHGDRVLDIGCGHGFGGDAALQKSISEESGWFVGVEPDPEIEIPTYFSEFHRTILEDAPLEKQSIDVAYSVFVLEHVECAQSFWQAIDHALAPGGIFWGFTVDGRHPFRLASGAMERLKVKDFYLNRVQGQRGEERYENYPTFYRANTPKSIRSFTEVFSHAEFLSLHRPGQLDFYVPLLLRPVTRTFERLSITMRCPGSVLVVRAEKPGVISEVR